MDLRTVIIEATDEVWAAEDGGVMLEHDWVEGGAGGGELLMLSVKDGASVQFGSGFEHGECSLAAFRRRGVVQSCMMTTPSWDARRLHDGTTGVTVELLQLRARGLACCCMRI